MTPTRTRPPPAVETGEDQPLAAEERRLRRILQVLAFLFLSGMLAYLVPAFLPSTQAAFVQLPFVTNSVVKVGVLGLLAFFAAANPRRHSLLTRLVITGHLVSIAATVAVLLFGDAAGTLIGSSLPLRPVLYGSIFLDGTIVLDSGPGLPRRGAGALAAALLDAPPVPGPHRPERGRHPRRGGGPLTEDVARDVDRYLADFRGRGKWISRLALLTVHLLPLLGLRAPFAYLPAAERREFIPAPVLRNHGSQALAGGVGAWPSRRPSAWASRLCYLGYYGDERTHGAVNYLPFSRRPSTPGRLAESPVKERLPLSVRTSADVAGEELEGDVVVIGSGAAGAILAYGLAGKGRSVLMLERGDDVDPSRFSEDEIEMLSKLYADGALQLTRDFKLQVLQG